ncbi:MAG TPA: hypothetical protein VFD31_10710 [Thermoleophilaceae bacterium]|nr:hypothetical protein [Thermoleophilaceae bacterium]
MKRIIARKPSPAFVIACIALFASMGGVSYAVATGSIDSREIKDNTIRAQDIRQNAVTASEIKRRSLDGTDIKIERVGGNAVKEQVLEVDKLKQVPSAKTADLAANGTRWALVNEQGQIEQQTGGFTIVNCYAANANCYINAGSDVTKSGIHAQISVANTDGIAILSGETGTAACGAATVACAPPATESNDVLVVAPRTRDDTGALTGTAPTPGTTPPAAADAARFYVFVTGPSNLK